MLVGACLPVAVTLGREPATGNGFETRAPEDFRLLADLGITDVRLGIDWARLQPQPGRVDDDWREWYQGAIDAARGAGIGVWAGLWERDVPGWFADEGGFTDDRAAGQWWPRWVELAADLIGDRVSGWFPMGDPVGAVAHEAADPARHGRALTNTLIGWRDAWRILRGGPPVATALGLRVVRPADHTVPALEASRLEDALRGRLWLHGLRDGTVALPGSPERELPDLSGALDLLGVELALDLGDDAPLLASGEAGPADDERRRTAMGRWSERVGIIVRRAAEEGPTRPLVAAALSLPWADDDDRRLMIDAFRSALDAACDDGVPIDGAFYHPAIDPATDHPSLRTGLADRDRNVRPSAGSWGRAREPRG